MIAVGNNEIGEYVEKGDYVVNGKLEGTLKYGTTPEGKENTIIGFITTEEGRNYLVAIHNRLLEGWRIKDE